MSKIGIFLTLAINEEKFSIAKATVKFYEADKG